MTEFNKINELFHLYYRVSGLAGEQSKLLLSYSDHKYDINTIKNFDALQDHLFNSSDNTQHLIKAIDKVQYKDSKLVILTDNTLSALIQTASVITLVKLISPITIVVKNLDSDEINKNDLNAGNVFLSVVNTMSANNKHKLRLITNLISCLCQQMFSIYHTNIDNWKTLITRETQEKSNHLSFYKFTLNFLTHIDIDNKGKELIHLTYLNTLLLCYGNKTDQILQLLIDLGLKKLESEPSLYPAFMASLGTDRECKENILETISILSTSLISGFSYLSILKLLLADKTSNANRLLYAQKQKNSLYVQNLSKKIRSLNLIASNQPEHNLLHIPVTEYKVPFSPVIGSALLEISKKVILFTKEKTTSTQEVDFAIIEKSNLNIDIFKSLPTLSRTDIGKNFAILVKKSTQTMMPVVELVSIFSGELKHLKYLEFDEIQNYTRKNIFTNYASDKHIFNTKIGKLIFDLTFPSEPKLYVSQTLTIDCILQTKKECLNTLYNVISESNIIRNLNKNDENTITFNIDKDHLQFKIDLINKSLINISAHNSIEPINLMQSKAINDLWFMNSLEQIWAFEGILDSIFEIEGTFTGYTNSSKFKNVWFTPKDSKVQYKAILDKEIIPDNKIFEKPLTILARYTPINSSKLRRFGLYIEKIL